MEYRIYLRDSIYRYAFGEIVDFIYNNMEELSNYKEANGIKMLCPSQNDVEKYKSFIKELKSFYEYDI